jgi:hypothetical protein
MFRSIPEPLCPICGRAEPQLVSQRELAHDQPSPSPREAEETAYTFKCQCGVTFLHTVRHRQPAEPLIAS